MDHSQAAASIFNKHAHLYQDKFMDVSLYGDTFDFFCSHITKQGADILELACGPGNISQYLLKKRPDFKLTGTDLSPNMIQLAKENNPRADFRLMDARDLSKLDSRFDGIMCGFCLPYLSMAETEALIRAAKEKLHASGLIYISTMEDDYSKSGFRKGSQGDEVFMHYYKEKDLLKILESHHFKSRLIQRKEFIMSDNSKVIDLIIIASLN